MRLPSPPKLKTGEGGMCCKRGPLEGGLHTGGSTCLGASASSPLGEGGAVCLGERQP